MLYYDFDKMCAGEIFDESGSGNNGMSRGRVVVEPGYNHDNGVDLSDGFIQLDGRNFKVWYRIMRYLSQLLLILKKSKTLIYYLKTVTYEFLRLVLCFYRLNLLS